MLGTNVLFLFGTKVTRFMPIASFQHEWFPLVIFHHQHLAYIGLGLVVSWTNFNARDQASIPYRHRSLLGLS